MKRLVGLAWVLGFIGCGGSAFTAGGDVGDGGTGSSSGGGGGSGGSTSSTSSSGPGSSSGGGSSSGTGSSTSSGVTASSSSGTGSSSSGGGSGSGMGGSSSSGVSGDAGQGDAIAPQVSCPPTAPDPSGILACKPALAGVTCEWGTASVPECDQVATCTSGKWVFQSPGASCAVESACPTTAPTNGQKCVATLSGTYCDYDYDGTTPLYRCACETSTMVAGLNTWVCQDPGGGCTMPRPRLGTACMSGANQAICDYGSCGVPGGNDETCTNGLWVQSTVECTDGVGGS